MRPIITYLCSPSLLSRSLSGNLCASSLLCRIRSLQAIFKCLTCAPGAFFIFVFERYSLPLPCEAELWLETEGTEAASHCRVAACKFTLSNPTKIHPRAHHDSWGCHGGWERLWEMSWTRLLGSTDHCLCRVRLLGNGWANALIWTKGQKAEGTLLFSWPSFFPPTHPPPLNTLWKRCLVVGDICVPLGPTALWSSLV